MNQLGHDEAVLVTILADQASSSSIGDLVRLKASLQPAEAA
jgi:hypothetical protein